MLIIFVLSRSRTISFCYEIYQPPPLGWSTYGTMSMQIGRYSATFVSTSLGTPSRAKKQFLHTKAIKVCPVFPNLCKAKGVTFRTFLLLVTSPASLTRHCFRRRVPFTTSDATFLLRNISIAKVSLTFHSANGAARLDQGFFFQVSLRLCERFLRKVETFSTLFACSLLRYFSARVLRD